MDNRAHEDRARPPLGLRGIGWPTLVGSLTSKEPDVHVAERKRNPFVNSAAGARALSAMHFPLFAIRPPSGYGVLTTTGRKTGKKRRRCIRVIRRGDEAYLVAIKGGITGWLKNAQANPNVRLRLRGGAFDGVARELRGQAETREAREAYCETVTPFSYLEFTMWRKGRPTRSKIKELHRAWFHEGTPLVVELRD
jgi:deazaflavin-dependent oxidoreductase (nitroreductase family)